MADVVLCAQALPVSDSKSRRATEWNDNAGDRDMAPSESTWLGRHYPTGVTLTDTSSRWPPEAKMTPSIGATSA